MGDAHALGELARLPLEAVLGEEADRLGDDRLLPVGRAHIAPPWPRLTGFGCGHACSCVGVGHAAPTRFQICDHLVILASAIAFASRHGAIDAIGGPAHDFVNDARTLASPDWAPPRHSMCGAMLS